MKSNRSFDYLRIPPELIFLFKEKKIVWFRPLQYPKSKCIVEQSKCVFVLVLVLPWASISLEQIPLPNILVQKMLCPSNIAHAQLPLYPYFCVCWCSATKPRFKSVIHSSVILGFSELRREGTVLI